MSNRTTSPRTLGGQLMLMGGALYIAERCWPGSYGDPVLQAASYGALGIAAVAAYRTAAILLERFPTFRRYLRAMRRDHSRGSASFLSEKDARKAGLHKRRKGARLVGVTGSTALWLQTEVHHLIIGASGSGKSSTAILHALCNSPESCVVNDTKGELYEQTARYRARYFGHRTVLLDPKRPEISAKINLLDGVFALIGAGSPEALTLARGMALQLLPEPKGGGAQDANKFFRDGGRELLATLKLAVAATCPAEHRNMTMVYRALKDMSVLHTILTAAIRSDALNGEIAAMAESEHRAAFGEDGAAKTFEQFRLGAEQAMQPFGPGNYLAAITSETTFSFTELKKGKVTAYIVIDYANKDVLGPFSGLMQWLAAYQLVAARSNTPVLFVLDEFCNAPLHILPTILTLLRSYGARCILATQDLEDITRVYGKEAKATVLSECQIQQYLAPIQSPPTLAHLSKALGEYTEVAASYSFADRGISESSGRTSRRLMTESELREMYDGWQIVFYRNMKPILCTKVPVFAIAPWRRRIAPNSMYGRGRRRLDPVQIRLRWFGTEVTPRGRLVWTRTGMILRRWLSPLLDWLMPAPVVLLAGVIALGVWLHGWPCLRIDIARDAPAADRRCTYIGPHGLTAVRGGNCPVILFLKTW